ncbi:hypothetical protein PCNPT3_07790 [Psychromonas sp. CNPT3]|uniref:N(4)-acetylcytidine aminohydrolase n=1 Tax=Psychromonas sp. CNPT3 TaxID=314282 RepID=UPI00006E34EA|nr:N(4)-acetylcytidine aminohydrolase [Psychromonas sp. CNPT3]AGH81496.1 hypothetical protein PCNPT3_07790 [Psychromonas sp. CNPT3]
MQEAPTTITFFDFLTPLVASGLKTITIRDKSENHYLPGTCVEVFGLESGRSVCHIEILSVKPIKFNDLNEFHAQQESLALDKLQQIIGEVYPNTEQLYIISFKLVNVN